MLFAGKKIRMPARDQAPPGRDTPMPVPEKHFVNGHPLRPPFPPGLERVQFAMGCFWGAEQRFWQTSGVYTTAVGYAGGFTPNPTYEEVCGGGTGHTEAVLVVFDPARLPFEELLRLFWEGHDPTQGMRQGNDIGTQYRSALYTYGEEQARKAAASRERYRQALGTMDLGPITTEIRPAPEFYYAEGYHQQYLAKNPAGYCGSGGCGVAFPR